MQMMDTNIMNSGRVTTFRFSIHGGSIQRGTADVLAKDMDKALRLMSALFPGCEFSQLQSQEDEWH